MTNEIKLLRAFIEASGYEIETTKDIKWAYHPDDINDQTGKPKENSRPESIINTTDYKVTKQEPLVQLPIQSKEWGCIVDFVTSHREDIINDVNDYGGLGFILDFMERNSND